MMMKVSWLTLIQNCLYTWDTDNNDNIIADIPHNMDPHLYNPGSEYKIQIFSPLQTEWCGWTACLACQLSHCVNLVKYFNKESYVAVENVSHRVN